MIKSFKKQKNCQHPPPPSPRGDKSINHLDGRLDLGLEALGGLEEAPERQAGVLPEPVELEQRLPLQDQVLPGEQVLLLQQRMQYLTGQLSNTVKGPGPAW